MKVNKSIIPAFYNTKMIICNYSHELLDEIFCCFRDMQLSQYDEFFSKFRRMIFKYITVQDFSLDRDDLRRLCMARGTEIYKRMFNLLKNLEHDFFLDQVLDNYEVNGKTLLVISEEHGDYLKTKIKDMEYITIKEIKNYYYNGMIYSFLPMNIFKHIYYMPSWEKGKVIQYKKMANSSYELFNCEIDFESKSYNIDIPLVNKNNEISMVDDIFESKLSDNLKECILIDDKFNVIRGRVLENQKYLYKFYIDNIDYENFTAGDLKKLRYLKMKKWKDSLRREKNIYRLCNFLSHYGAVNAKDYNVKNWMKDGTIAPDDERDFRAILKYSGIHDEKEIKDYFNIAKELRSESISQGYINKDIVYELLVEYINENKHNLSDLVSSETIDLSGIYFKVNRGCI